MGLQSVQFEYEVHCDWADVPPIYRLYVNEELFAERTWIWGSSYLEENLQILAEPGEYVIRYELVPPHLAQLRVENIRVEFGPGLIENNILRIVNETA